MGCGMYVIMKILIPLKPICSAQSRYTHHLAVLSLLDEYMDDINDRLINLVHDEFVFEVAEKNVDRALVAVENVMVAGMLQIFPDASTKNLVDAHAGDNWEDAK